MTVDAKHNSPSVQQRRCSPPITLLQANYAHSNNLNGHIDMSTLKHVPLPQPSSDSLRQSQIPLPPPPPTTSTPSNSNHHQVMTSTPYTPISKHWIWNSNIFYPQSRGFHDGFLPYSTNFSGLFASPKTKGWHSVHTNGQNISIKTVDLSLSSQRDCCSDQNSDSDSLDVSEGKKTPTPLSTIPPISTDENVAARTALTSANFPANTSATVATESRTIPNSIRKRNPYSIEELLKKPEKRIRLEPISFHPPIIIHNRDQSKSPADIVVQNGNLEKNTETILINLDNSKTNTSINNDSIEVCD